VRATVRTGDIDACGLTLSELQELWLGACNSSVFNSPEELRDAWARGRDVAMRLWARDGRRPQGWWAFEAGDLRYPGYNRERSTLWRAGKLSPGEKEGLETEWEMEFQRAQAPDFSMDGSSGDLLKGDCARAAHYAHHDIPRELVKRWSAARRRRERRSVSLEEAAAIK